MIPPAGRWRRPQVQAGVQQCRGRGLSEHDLGRGRANGRRVRRNYWNWLTTEVRRDLEQYKIREPFYPYNTSFSSEDGWRGACASRRRDSRLRLLQALVMQHAPQSSLSVLRLQRPPAQRARGQGAPARDVWILRNAAAPPQHGVNSVEEVVCGANLCWHVRGGPNNRARNG